MSRRALNVSESDSLAWNACVFSTRLDLGVVPVYNLNILSLTPKIMTVPFVTWRFLLIARHFDLM
ncbi:MAG: hypothetical protein P8104_10460, partial [Gammaproteobacteria bacterium]